ncbi:MAG: hypothetical protein JWN14_1493 [Chthonomonadales bacterium]|nr:hypothetical protein [Chthonomonadales bacterium]
MILERIDAAAANGAVDEPVRELGMLYHGWNRRPEREISIPDFIRESHKSHGFLSYKSTTDKRFCLMAFYRDGKNDCLITKAEFDRLAFDVRQRLNAYLTELEGVIFQEVAQRLLEAGFTFSFARNPEEGREDAMVFEEDDEYAGDYDLYLEVSWMQGSRPTQQAPTPSSLGSQSFLHWITGSY